MTDTPNLRLPFIAAAQAQKHVTHNEALIALDALVQLSVTDRTHAAPPADPAEGGRWLVAASATGAFAGKSGQIALHQAGGWRFYPPQPGWLAYVAAEGAFLVWSGTGWASLDAGVSDTLQNVTRFGLGTAADAGNPFSAKLNDALWTARGTGEGGTGDLRTKMNKESAARVLSLLMQDNYSGRAEIGLIGDDDLTIKVSADGTAWREALRIAGGTGRVSLPMGISGTADGTGFRNRLVNGAFAINQRLAASSASDTYIHDRWYVLTQSAPVSAATLTDPEAGSPTALRLTQAAPSAQRFGVAQIVEQAAIRDLRYAPVVLSGRVRVSVSASVGVALLAQTGTPDVVTSDVVGSWTSTSFTTGGFFRGGLTVVAQATLNAPAGTWVDLPALAAIFADVANAIVMVWVQGSAAQNAALDLARMQLEPGSVPTAFEVLPAALELQRCQRFFEKSFDLGTVPGGAATTGAVGGLTSRDGTTASALSISFRTRKRAAPSISFWDTAAHAGRFSGYTVSGGFVPDQPGASLIAVGEGGFALAGPGPTQFVQFAADAEL